MFMLKLSFQMCLYQACINIGLLWHTKINIQVYLVTGGDDGRSDRLSSTEVLTNGDNSWKVVGELPQTMSGMRAVSIANTIIVTGNIITVVIL